MAYPDRKGWSSSELMGKKDFGGRSQNEVQSFFQTWLYFGLIISIFKIGLGVEFRTQDFLRESPAGKH